MPLIVSIWLSWPKTEDNSYIATTDKSFEVGNQNDRDSKRTNPNVPIEQEQTSKRKKGPTPKGNGANIALKNIRYQAKQVFVRADISDPKRTLPIGSSMIGKLLTTINTQDVGKLAKILLPYGGSYNSNKVLPEETVLFASVNYPGNGDKVYLTISNGLLPNGNEIQINGQAQDSKDFSTGIIGEYFGTFSNRIASSLALSFISAGSDIMVEKEALGQANTITAKSTFKNAGLSGLSEVAKMESQRQAQEIGDAKPYVIVDEGKDLIISLTQTFSHKEQN